MNKIIGWLVAVVVVAVLGFTVFSLFNGTEPGKIGGSIHNTQESFDAGIAVNGTEVISDTRAINASTLTVSGASTLTGDTTLTGEVTLKEGSTTLAPTSISATTTLTAANSGTTYYLSASGTTIILPAVTTAGLNYRFVINGAADTGNFIIDSAEGDNVEGTLIVAGAVVDCAAEDQLDFVVDGENVGDYVEVRSDGTQWLIGDSGVLTAGKLTCTDPS